MKRGTQRYMREASHFVSLVSRCFGRCCDAKGAAAGLQPHRESFPSLYPCDSVFSGSCLGRLPGSCFEA